MIRPTLKRLVIVEPSPRFVSKPFHCVKASRTIHKRFNKAFARHLDTSNQKITLSSIEEVSARGQSGAEAFALAMVAWSLSTGTEVDSETSETSMPTGSMLEILLGGSCDTGMLVGFRSFAGSSHDASMFTDCVCMKPPVGFGGQGPDKT